MPETGTIQIHTLLKPEAIKVGLEGETKVDVIDHLIDLIAHEPSVHDADQVRQAVLDREEIMSTGVGKGLALPHAKSPAVTETLVAFAVMRAPVDFGSIDNAPVNLIFLMVGPDGARSQHIKLLSRVSRLMNRESFRESLLKARSPDEIIETFREGEEQMIDS